MKLLSAKVAVIVGASALALSAPMTTSASAAAPKANTSEKAGPASPAAAAVLEARLSGDLAKWGREANSPEALIVAAQILAAVGATDTARTKTSQAETGPATATPKAEKPAATVASLLHEARALAGPDLPLQAEITRVAALENRGRVGGPARSFERVAARAADTYTIPFRGGESAAIYVNGDGDTDLDLYVYDQNGNQVCNATDSSDTMLCRWTPAWTGNFTVKIKNYGAIFNSYALLTN